MSSVRLFYSRVTQLRADEALVKKVNSALERIAANHSRFSSWKNLKKNEIEIQIEMVVEKGLWNNWGEFDENLTRGAEYQSFSLTYEQAAVCLPVIEAALTELVIKPSLIAQIEVKQKRTDTKTGCDRSLQ